MVNIYMYVSRKDLVQNEIHFANTSPNVPVDALNGLFIAPGPTESLLRFVPQDGVSGF